MASARSVAVDVPSPASLLAAVAASRTTCRPIFSTRSRELTCAATVAPSFDTYGWRSPSFVTPT